MRNVAIVAGMTAASIALAVVLFVVGSSPGFDRDTGGAIGIPIALLIFFSIGGVGGTWEESRKAWRRRHHPCTCGHRWRHDDWCQKERG